MRSLGIILLLCVTACIKAPSFETVTTPTTGSAKAIGSYSNGCLVGAVSLPPDGVGYQFMRLSRRRFYGHPTLLRFIRQLAEERKKSDKNSMLLIGDMAQPRGGKMPGSHDSHQTGLDVDIWYWYPAHAATQSLTLDERENLSAPSLLDRTTGTIKPDLWNEQMRATLQSAASFPEVERIFVHPVVKRALCQQYPKQGWLQKIRPWWGHDDHFHVRLRCSPDDSTCTAQKTPLPAGDGCDATLDWWFTAEASQTKTAKQELKKPPAVLDSCKKILTPITINNLW